jgi:hypothetical protein
MRPISSRGSCRLCRQSSEGPTAYTAAAALAVGLAVLAPCTTVLFTPPDEPAPSEIAPKLAAAKHSLVHNVDRGWTRARYIGLETRDSDKLVVLRFEIYGWPNFAPLRAYLASRCRSLAEIEPASMSGGVVAGDFATEPELEYIRSSAQAPCPSG